MTGPSSTARRGRGRFSCHNGGDVKEDTGSDGDDGTPDNRGSGEEHDYGIALPATAVNPLDSVKRAHQKSNHVPYYLFIVIICLGNMYYGVTDTFLT